MEAKIQRWGNSLGVRIPAAIARELHLRNGSVVDVVEESNSIVIRPAKNHDIHSLLDSITDDNRHSEVDWGTREGNEAW